MTCDPDGEPLLDGVDPVPDEYFTASSEDASGFYARYARMSAIKCWIPSYEEMNAYPKTYYLQVCHGL